MNIKELQERSWRRRILDAAWLLALLCLTGGLLLLYAIPWVTLPSIGGGDLTRYAPMADGEAWLAERRTPDGKVLSYISTNIMKIPPGELAAMAENDSSYQILNAFIHGGDVPEGDRNALIRELSLSQAFMIDSRELRGSLAATSSSLVIRSDDGDRLLGSSRNGAPGLEYYDPPILLRPSRLQSGRTWEGRGSTTAGQSYRYMGKIGPAGSYTNSRGQAYPDCLTLEFSLTLSGEGKADVNRISVQRLCAGAGMVAEEVWDDAGSAPACTLEVLSSTLMTDGAVKGGIQVVELPEASLQPGPSSPDLEGADFTSWKLTRVSVPPAGEDDFNYESTIRPVWVPTDPPAILSASLNGGLVARSSEPPDYGILWQFHPGGTIFGQPGIDPASGTIYFGTSSGKLVALQPGGLFLWSFDAGDNIASQPLVSGDAVIFGSEDRNVYALNRDSGELLWKFRTDGAVASSAAAAGSLAVIGSDDGNVYALDAETGKPRWIFSTDDAVEAPILSSGGVVYAASRDMFLYALDAAMGDLLWQAETTEALHSAPAVGKDAVYFTDEYGAIYAFGLQKGNYLWSDNKRIYYSPLLAAGDTLIAAGDNGLIYVLSTDGSDKLPPVAAYTGEGERSEAGFLLGVAPGGGAVWLSDFNGQAWRFGP